MLKKKKNLLPAIAVFFDRTHLWTKFVKMDYVKKMERHIPKCLHCGEQIRYGRTDKRYCCDECRNNHYNAQTKAGRAFRRRVLSQLSSNYEILDKLVRAGMESLDLIDAVTMGFTPGIVTSYRRSGKHDEFRCFDIKYYMTRTRLFAISKIQNVSLPLQPDKQRQ